MEGDDSQQDIALYRHAFGEVRTTLLQLAKKIGEPRKLGELVDMSADLKATAERFDSMVRGVIDLQGRTVI